MREHDCVVCGQKTIRPKYCSYQCAADANRVNARERHGKVTILLADVNIQKRECLRCGNMFRSQGAWNRICGRCGESNRQESPRVVAYPSRHKENGCARQG